MVQARGRGRRLSADATRILVAQAARACAYGLGSVLIGVTLARRGLSGAETGAVLAGLLAGIAVVSVLLARYGDRVGRRRFYRLLFVAMAAAGSVFALTSFLPALVIAALTGTVSTEVVESGPFTSLEQAMLPHTGGGAGSTRLFGIYNTVATLAGSLGALLALVGSSAHWLLVYPLAAATGFVAYLFARKFGASPHTLALVFFSIGLAQALSFQAAVRLAARIGLLRTMVLTHLPSNVLLAAIAFAPGPRSAIALLLARSLLSQMDVPTRQAYVVAVVDPSERIAAAAYTNTARYLTRPIAPLLAGVALRGALGVPFVVAGALKSLYDVVLYALFRDVRIEGESRG